MSRLTSSRRHGFTVFFADVAAVTAVMFFTCIAQFDELNESAAKFLPNANLTASVNPLALAITMYLLWISALVVGRSWNPHIAGTGLPEYLLVSKSVLTVLFILAFGALVFKVDVSRKFVFTALSLGLAALIASRWFARQWLLERRRQGKITRRTLVLGPEKNSLEFIEKLVADKASGFTPTKFLSLRGPVPVEVSNRLKSLGVSFAYFDKSEFEAVIDESIEAVLVVSAGEIDQSTLRAISWTLEGKSVELIVSSGLVDFAGSRLSSQIVAGAQFLFVETPTFQGFKFLAKSILDFAFALSALVMFSPLMLLTGVAIWLEDFGPIFYSQERVGANGKIFKILKFRSMVVDADKLHSQLRAEDVNQVNRRMFKDPGDPRMTKVGRLIRRFSIDELPQIFNVFSGTMSFVGPRPPLASEVAEYEPHERRRLLVKPGMTGIWQVSGRSLLTWEETIRLDLYYVENWTILTDFLIVLRTLKAVLDGRGAF